MYKLINCGGTYHQLPDNMRKTHPFVFDASHIKSAIDRTYMAVLVDARWKRNVHYSKENVDDDSESYESTDSRDDYAQLVKR